MITEGPISCLVADDQAMVRESFGALLAAQPDLTVVGQAADGAAAVRLAEELHPDVILMDVRMPVMDGLVEAAARAIETFAGEALLGGGIEVRPAHGVSA